jgi:aspartate kinase
MSKNQLLVLKFGGTSVGDVARIQHAASIAAREAAAGHRVAVVVSAMSGQTNQLLSWVKEIDPLYDAAEHDTVVSTGEQVTIGLFALALQKQGYKSRSYCGWQVPIHTDATHGKARITGIDTTILTQSLSEGVIPVIAGFQGVTDAGRITTIGRGGSDTAAVAIAAALNADRCDIYTDVDGVYTTDPRIVPKAKRMDKISFEEMLELASLGAKVLQTRSVELAMKERVRVRVVSTFKDGGGTTVVPEEEIVEQQVVSGIAYSRDEAKITLFSIDDKPGVSASIFGPLAKAAINVDMIVQSIAGDSNKTDMTFTIPRSELPLARKILEEQSAAIGYKNLHIDEVVAKISVVGLGMRSHPGTAQIMFQTLADKGINIKVISTSEIKIRVLIDEAYTELALRALHTAYDLDAA